MLSRRPVNHKATPLSRNPGRMTNHQIASVFAMRKRVEGSPRVREVQILECGPLTSLEAYTNPEKVVEFTS